MHLTSCRCGGFVGKRVFPWILALAVARVAGGAGEPGEDAAARPMLALDAGAAEIFDRRPECFWILHYRPAFRFRRIGPWLLFGSGSDSEYYAAAGVLSEFPLGRRWLLIPSFGGGYYDSSGGLDLGFDMQFRSALEASFRFRNGKRLGVAFAHLSNASLAERNPGTETLSIVFSLPLK